MRSWNGLYEASKMDMDEETRRFVVIELDKLDADFTTHFGEKCHFMTRAESWETSWSYYIEAIQRHATSVAKRMDLPDKIGHIVDDLGAKMKFVMMAAGQNTLLPPMPLMTKTVASQMVNALREIPLALLEVSTRKIHDLLAGQAYLTCGRLFATRSNGFDLGDNPFINPVSFRY
jgi:hypothetical protein